MSDTNAPAVTPIRIIVDGPEGSGQEVFEGASWEEASSKLAEGKKHATAKIHEQAEELARLRGRLEESERQKVVPEVKPKGSFDRNRFFQLMAETPEEALDYYWQFKTGMSLDELTQDYIESRERQNQLESAFIRREVSSAFAIRHPELLQVSREDDLKNAEVLSKVITERNWQYSVENLEAAYQIAKVDGKLKLPAPAETNLGGTQTSAGNPPLTLSPQRSGVTTDTEAEFEKFVRTEPDIEKVRRAIEERSAARLRQASNA